jgi:hypothetical protein
MQKPLPCLPLVTPLPPNFIAQPLQSVPLEMTRNTLFRRYEFMVDKTAAVKEFREQFGPLCSINEINAGFD